MKIRVIRGSEMTYTFRPNLFVKQRTVRLTDRGIEQLAPDGSVKRTIPYREVQSISEVIGGLGHDPQSGAFVQQYVTIKGCGSLTIKGFSYLGAHSKTSIKATNNADEYEPLVRRLKERLVANNPNVQLIEGHLFASLMAWFVFLLCLVGLPLLAISGLFYGKGTFWERAGVALIVLVMAGLLGLPCRSLATHYWPKKRRLAETLEG
ncbi:MAG: hypothetical protein RH917_03705 [Lacipirellulaceae bacterium]